MEMRVNFNFEVPYQGKKVKISMLFTLSQSANSTAMSKSLIHKNQAIFP